MELRRLGFAVSIAFFVQVVFLFPLASGQLTNITSKEIYAEGYCSMYGICAKRSDGKVLNCPNRTHSIKPDELLSSKIQSLCPSITGNVCCSQDQFDTLRGQVQQVIPFLVGCPACLRNFLNLFCELSCSPDQSLFINVTSVKKVNGSLAVDGIDFYVSSRYGEQLYDSCKDVKFGSLNSRAMDLVGAGAKDYSEWFAFIGRQANLNEIGSPYAITFRSNISNSSGMKPMNVTVYSCGDSSLGCSCGDCPSSSVCSDSLPQAPPENKSCSIKLGSLKIKCLRFSLGIVYILFVSAFLVWDFLYRRKGRRNYPFRQKESLSLKDNGLHSSDKQGDRPQSLQTLAEASVVKAQKSSVVQGYMAKFFRNYGSFVSKHPTLVLFLSLAVPLLLCIGLIHFKVETRPEKLWVGPGSKAAQEKQYFDSHLAPFYRIEQILLATIPSSEHEKPPGIVTDKNLKLLFELQKKVNELQGNYSGSMVSLKDICLKPLGEECATQSILQYYKMDPSNYDTYGGIDHAEYCFQHYSSAEKCLSAYQSPLDPSTAVGGFSGSNYSEATALIVTYPVNNVLDKTGNENLMAVAWEKAFIRLMQEELLPLVKEQNLTLSFSSESSIQEELKRESTADIITILISYLVMFIYISLMLGDSPRFSLFVSSKVLLGLSGVVLVLLSVLASMGFYSAIGVKSTLIIMEVIPFLVLAVGVDNMCILVHAVKRQPFELPLDQKVSNALVEVGPSITLASLSEVLAFAVGAFIPMPACRVFSMFAALAVLLDFLLQVTAFVALIIFDFLRAENHRVDCVPCIKLRSNARANDGAGPQDIGLLARYMRDVHSRILGLRGVKIFVIVVFIGFAFVSIVLCTSKIQPGLEQKVVLPRDSYLQGYFDDLAKYLRVGPPLYFVVKDFNYSSESMQTNKICSISQCNSDSLLNEITKASLSSSTTYIAKSAASWIDDFLVWLSPEAFSCCRKFINGSYCPPDDQPPCTKDGTCRDCTTCFLHSDLHDSRPSTVQFKEKLPWFLNALPSTNCAKGGKGAYTTNVDLNGYESGIIQASAFRTYHTPLNKQSDYVNALRAARDFSSKMSDSLKMEVFPYSVFYIFFEQYLDIWKTALINISIGLGAVFVVCLIFTSSLWSSTIILLVLAMIIVDMMGVMAILDIQLNAISVVNLVMSIGIAVEFCVHIMHSFSVSSGDRDTRTKMALSTMGASVFSGITLTKLVGVIVLHFSKSEVFVVYYFQMYLSLVLIGFLHGLVFLPVVLSICGPPQVQSPLDGDQNQITSLPVVDS